MKFYSVCKEDADCIDDRKPKCDAATGKCGKGSLYNVYCLCIYYLATFMELGIIEFSKCERNA